MNLFKKSLRNPKCIVVLGLLLLGIGLLMTRGFQTPAKEISYAELDQLMQAKKMQGTRIEPTPYPGIYRIEGIYEGRGGTHRYFITTRLDEGQAKALFATSGTKVVLSGQEARGQMVNIIATLIIAGLIVGVVVFQFNIGRGRNSRVRIRPVERFCDVSGIDEAKAEVQEVVDFIRDPKKYERLGGNLPKGVLLIGPPGTGKTMLAKAIAGEANASFMGVISRKCSSASAPGGCASFSGRRVATSPPSSSLTNSIAWEGTATPTPMVNISRRLTPCWRRWTVSRAARES